MRLLVISFTLLALWLPAVASAETDTCTCYCGTSSLGADQQGVFSPNDCSDVCGGLGMEYVGCYDDPLQYPRFSDLCWRQYDCEGQTTEYGGEYEWEDDTAFCEDSPEPMGYCYAPPRPVSLMVDLGSVTEATSIAGYVDALYRLLVPAMTLVAVIMVMIAGMQYILARGRAEAIKLAKDRMTKAVIGLVLLISAYTIARLFDPSLVNIKQLRIPMMKEVALLEDDNTCEYLASLGYQIDKKTGNEVTKGCGLTGKITKLSPFVNSSDWAVDDPCIYSTCSEGWKCSGSEAAGYECASCAQVYEINNGITEVTTSESGLSPSPSLCSSMSLPYDVDDKKSKKYICTYLEYGLASVCAQISDTQTAGTSAIPAVSGLNCQALRSDSGSCRSYDGVYANFYDFDPVALVAPDPIAYMLTRDNSLALQILNIFDPVRGDELFESICTQDPCGLAPPGTSGCLYRESGYYRDCYSKKDTLAPNEDGEIVTGICYDLEDNQITCKE